MKGDAYGRARLPRFAPALTIALGLLGAAYLGEGFWRLLSGVMPQDLGRRWLENAYLVRGISPSEVFLGHIPAAPDLGPMHPGGYPPWSMAIALLVAPPVAPVWLRDYFALQNVLALLIVGRYAYRTGARHGTAAARLLCASVLAISTNAVVLRNGQYGLLVNAFLVGVLAAEAAKKPVHQGLALALAALKPQSSFPFALLLFRRGGSAGLVACASALLFATGAVSLLLARSPFTLLEQAFHESGLWARADSGPLRLLLEAGVPQPVAIPGLAATLLVGGMALFWRLRGQPHLSRVALFAVVARLWTYHRRYDDVLLVFLLVPVGVHALEKRTLSAWLAFFGVGLTLWLPLREQDHGTALILLKLTVWLVALAGLLLAGARPVSADESSKPAAEPARFVARSLLDQGSTS